MSVGFCCPNCGYAETFVTNSRPQFDGREIRRKRECRECQYRWDTIESEDTEFDFRSQLADLEQAIINVNNIVKKLQRDYRRRVRRVKTGLMHGDEMEHRRSGNVADDADEEH